MALKPKAFQLEMERDEAFAKILKFSDDSRTGGLPSAVRLRVISLSAQRIMNLNHALSQRNPPKKRDFFGRLFSG